MSEAVQKVNNGAEPRLSSVPLFRQTGRVAQLASRSRQVLALQNIQALMDGSRQTKQLTARQQATNSRVPVQRRVDDSKISDVEVKQALTLAKSLGVFQDVAANDQIQVNVDLNSAADEGSYADVRVIRWSGPITYEITLYKQACSRDGKFEPGIAAYALQHEMDLHVLKTDGEGRRSANTDKRHPNKKDAEEHQKIITPWDVTISETLSIIRTRGDYARRVVEQLQVGLSLENSYRDIYAYYCSYCNDVVNTIRSKFLNCIDASRPAPHYGVLTKQDLWDVMAVFDEVFHALLEACAAKVIQTEEESVKLEKFKQLATKKFAECRQNLQLERLESGLEK
ncbi:hypothetical protein GJ699_33530 [Duganella sp. FT80W]|uniref:Uncharacterized protein n=1 Tax=Duganella guangzhouensis TaxID=2666084 RepID=A0A6I2LDI0_9BURK|nr:hypothetical protein [Duganella guangzhouensis]MRW94884.1 hypothetical protein [Duganella guangzhouensis]